MSESNPNKVVEFIVNNWVSWLIEIVILGVIAFFTISETRKTAEQTREMLARYDAAISQYAKEKTEAVDNAVASGMDAAKEKAKSMSIDDVKGAFKALKSEEAEDEKEDRNNKNN